MWETNGTTVEKERTGRRNDAFCFVFCFMVLCFDLVREREGRPGVKLHVAGTVSEAGNVIEAAVARLDIHLAGWVTIALVGSLKMKMGGLIRK